MILVIEFLLSYSLDGSTRDRFVVQRGQMSLVTYIEVEAGIIFDLTTSPFSLKRGSSILVEGTEQPWYGKLDIVEHVLFLISLSMQ